MLRLSSFAWALLAAAAVSAQQAPEDPVYFEEEPAAWSFDWGTDTAFTLSNLEDASTNETNDGTTNFDTLWMRLYGRLERGDQAEFVVDLYSANGGAPRVFGLYGRIQPRPELGVRVGLIPLVFGGWQQRAAPSRQPLINQPLFSQYLVPLRNDGVPRSVSELLSQRGRQRRTAYDLGAGGGRVASLAYERCWDTGIELLGDVGRFRYQLAAMAGVPGVSVGPGDTNASRGPGIHARVVMDVSEAAFVGVSFASGRYLRDDIGFELPDARSLDDFRQEVFGADLGWSFDRFELFGEWVLSRYGSPFIAEPLETHGFYAELSAALGGGVRLAARYSGLIHSDVVAEPGTPISWEADSRRFEAGVIYQFWEHVALKAVFQRTQLDLEPRFEEDVYALQLAVAR